METRRLGSSGPELSVLGFGAWQASGHWGEDLDEERYVETIRSAVESGINWIDTAEVYGPHTSEDLVGRAAKGLEVMIATKVAPKGAGSGFRPEEVRKACEGSLARLGRPVIDLYQLHWPDEGIPVEETWGAMAALQDEGLVRWIGLSNFDEELIERCERVRHVDSLQPHLSLLHRGSEGLVRWCGERGIGVVAYGPLAYGLLTGTITKDTKFDPTDWRTGNRNFILYREFFAPGRFEESLAKIDRLRPVAERLEVALADLAVAWVLQRPGVTSAIVGSRNPRHVRENAERATAVVLDRSTLDEIDGALA